MSRCGYSDDHDDLALGRWRGQVTSSICGKRGQVFLHKALAALDAIPDKKLYPNKLQGKDNCFCVVGAVAHHQGINITDTEDDDYFYLAQLMDVSQQMIQELFYKNDEEFTYFSPVPERGFLNESSPEKRWKLMRDWVASQIKTEGLTGAI